MTPSTLFEDLSGYIDNSQASQILGVSEATLKNWVRAKHLQSSLVVKNKPLFLEKDIIVYKEKLQNGNVDKLKSRANKKNSAITFIPKEQIHNSSDFRKIENLTTFIKNKNVSLENALYYLAIYLLNLKGVVNFKIGQEKRVLGITCKTTHVKKILTEWRSEVENITPVYYDDLISNLELDLYPDLLGLIYQSLLSEGKKAQGGSYYTPEKVVNEIISQFELDSIKDKRVLDPCCGTGQFLLSFAKHGADPTNLFGFDIDKTAVRIAQVNLLLACPDKFFMPNVYYKNSLIDEVEAKYDIIATNPPWGFHFDGETKRILEKRYYSISSGEIFSYFILRGIQLLKEGGELAYLLPESMLKVKQHFDIRKNILEDAEVVSIKHLGNIFTKVVSPVVVLRLRKHPSEGEVEITNISGKIYRVQQERFFKNVNYTFDTSMTRDDEKLIKKIYGKEHLILKDHAEWALGIVTGNNKLYLSDSKDQDNEPILKGSDLKKYYFEQPQSFIKFEPNMFQQVAPMRLYRSDEKIIYRFISKTLVFAYDNKQILTLNSANVLLPKIHGYPIKVVLAYLNSSLFQFLFEKKFNTVKVLRGDLEKLPFPVINKVTGAEIASLVDELINPNLNADVRGQNIEKLDEIIYKTFDLDNADVDKVKSSL